ncbi:MAG TPA: hypothetical protein EYN06_08840, partial [Myxococcales bacterium]|nr:hypothetical protein [Myxococcales bacterium]
ETIVLVPTKAGTLTIASARLIQEGRVVAQSNPVTVQVRAIAAMSPGQAKQLRTSDVLLLVPEFDRDRYYVGEPFVATWALYIKQGLRISTPQLSELAAPEAVQRRDVLGGEYKEQGKSRMINGVRYSRVPVIQEVWKILRPEVLTIPGVKLETDIRTGGNRSFFGRNSQTKRVKAPPISLAVVAVPTQGRPAGYREGAVGRFKVSTQLKYDENQGRALLEVEVKGIGSLKTVDAPEIPHIANAEIRMLPSEDRDDLVVDQRGVQGRRVFQYLVTPKNKGKITINSIVLHYFNPRTGAFESSKTAPISFTAERAIASLFKSKEETPVSDKKLKLHPIESDSSLESINRAPVHTQPWFLMTLALPFLALLGIEITTAFNKRRLADSDKIRAKHAHSSGRKRLKAAQAYMKAEKIGDFYSELAKTIRTYVEDKHGVALAGMTNLQMRTALTQAGYDASVAEQLVVELENCDFARFAPGGQPGLQMEQALERSSAILNQIKSTHVA